MKTAYFLPLLTSVFTFTNAPAKMVEGIDVTQDVIYGHKLGLAMTLDVMKPEKQNGAAVVFMVSGGWVSVWAEAGPFVTDAMNNRDRNGWGMLLDQGYTLFTVRHGSSPVFKVPDAVADVRRAVRFIRLTADDYGIDPDRIGVFGGSAGGHLSLMLGTTADEGNPTSSDPVLQQSSRVAAVVAYFPPTDLREWVGSADFAALQFPSEAAPAVSPILHVTSDDAPTLLLHGEMDDLVPMRNSVDIEKRFRDEGVPTELVRFPESGHGFTGESEKRASKAMVAWFEKHLTGDKAPQGDSLDLAGTWDAEGERPEGGVRENVLVFEKSGDSFTCTVTIDDREIAMDWVSLEGKKVTLTKEIERDGIAAFVTVEATAEAPGLLSGRWMMDVGAEEVASGAWKATKRAAPTPEIVGSWTGSSSNSEDGSENKLRLTFKKSPGGFEGEIQVGEGDLSKLDTVTFDGSVLSFASTFEMDGESFSVDAKSEGINGRTMHGTWSIRNPGGQPVASGGWKVSAE